MEKRELLQDEFLRNLMKESSLESPSDDFTNKVMGHVETMPVYQSHKNPFIDIVKSVFPWILLVVIVVLFYIFFGLPFGKYIPVGEYTLDIISPSINTFIDSFKNLFSTKFYSIGLVVLLCGFGLYGIDRLITARITAHRHYLI